MFFIVDMVDVFSRQVPAPAIDEETVNQSCFGVSCFGASFCFIQW